MNKDIEKALTYANTQIDKIRNYLSDTYGITKFWYNKDEVRWDDLVTFHNSELNLASKPSKFTLAMLIYLLEKLAMLAYCVRSPLDIKPLLKHYEKDEFWLQLLLKSSASGLEIESSSEGSLLKVKDLQTQRSKVVSAYSILDL